MAEPIHNDEYARNDEPPTVVTVHPWSPTATQPGQTP